MSFPSGQERATGVEPPAPGCIARREDDGGRSLADQPESPRFPLDRFSPVAAFAVPPALALATLALVSVSCAALGGSFAGITPSATPDG
jgi:hypothetical protein